MSLRLEPHTLQLERRRNHDFDFLDKKVLYTTIMNTAIELRDSHPLRYHYGFGILSRSLDECRPESHLYATIIEELTLSPGITVVSNRS
jgi:hypothetical protein